MSDPGNFCFQSNPDISGIGVRTAIYAQNLLSFAPAIHAIQDKVVTSAELESVETQSTTILITAFAILVSAIVQAATLGLTNFHTTIVLNLSWMNNTNTFIYFLLYIHRHACLEMIQTQPDPPQLNSEKQETTPVVARLARLLPRSIRERFPTWIFRPVIRDSVLLLGSLHLSLMAALGLWLWSQPSAFGQSPSCTASVDIVIFGRNVALSSQPLRIWSIFIYTILLVPFFNLATPIFSFLIPYIVFNPPQNKATVTEKLPRITPITFGLIVLFATNIILIVDTEVALRRNAPLQQEGDGDWTFGQTLALLLLLVPLRDLYETLSNRREKNSERIRREGWEEDWRISVRIWRNHHKREDFSVLENFINKVGAARVDARGATYHDVFYQSSSAGRQGVVAFLLENGIGVNTISDEFPSALQAASERGRLVIVKLLVENGADVNLTGGKFGSALQAASSLDDADIVEFLYQQGANVNTTGGNLGSAIQAASYWGKLGIVKFLVEHGADVNLTNGTEYGSALRAACWSGNLGVVEFLVGHGADINDVKGGNYGSALQIASHNGFLDVVKLLLDHGADATATGGRFGPALYGASTSGSLDVVKLLIERGVDINSTGGQREGSALAGACCNSELEITKFLVEHGADINDTGGSYGAALQAASHWGAIDIAKFLMEQCGVDVNTPGGEYGSALQAASCWGLDIVNYLVEHGANVNSTGGRYGSPIEAATFFRHPNVVEFLLKHGAHRSAQRTIY